MSVLVLHQRSPLSTTPYDSWLADYPGDVLLLCSQESLDTFGEGLPAAGRGYRHVEAVAGYEGGGHLERRVLELAREHRVRYLIAAQERDLDRAAQLREILDLPGQRYDGVVPFRDKLTMKRLVGAAGVPVARHRAVDCATDLISFARDAGLPVVVKPRDGAGSFGVRILRDHDALHAFLADEFDLAEDRRSNLMVEAFVSDTMCHVDGMIVDGQVVYAWPSRYMYALAVYQDDRDGRMDVTLDADDPLHARLLELTDRVLGALPGPADFTFHAEIFLTPDDDLVLGEIACRTGGAAQRDIQRTMFGFDPTGCWIRAQVGLPLPFRPGDRLRPRSLTGQLALLKRPGTVLAVPGEPPFPWVRSRTVSVKPGDVLGPPAFAADFMAVFVIEAPDRETSVRRMRMLERWFLDGTVLSGRGAA